MIGLRGVLYVDGGDRGEGEGERGQEAIGICGSRRIGSKAAAAPQQRYQQEQEEPQILDVESSLFIALCWPNEEQR